MRGLIIGATLVLAACGGTAQQDTKPVVAAPGQVSQNAQELQVRETQDGSIIRGAYCSRTSLSDVLEQVGQTAHVTPDPFRDSRLAALHARFGALLDLTGKCYKGVPTDQSSEQLADIQYWSLTLGGAAIAIEHAFTDGSYGGISYVYPQADSDDFTYVYITNAGFHTQGTITLSDDRSFTATETVQGHPTITEVRSVTTFDETGITSMTSEFLDNGTWAPGPSFTHEVTKDPFPRLRTPGANTAD